MTSQVLLLSYGKPAASGSMAEVLRPEILSAVFRFPVQVRVNGGRYYLEVHPAAWNDLIKRPVR
jgi:ABC-type hemin transport system ATPase subunit